MWLLITTTLLIALAAFLSISYTLQVVVVLVLADVLSAVRRGRSLPWLMVYLVWIAWWRRGNGMTASLSAG